MNEASLSKPPVGFWIIAGLSLLWNAFGAYLYTMTNLGDPAMLDGASPAMRDYVAAMPIWAHSGWALGIWGSFLGSVLLLIRSRHAVTSFLISLAGAAVSFAAQAMAGVLEPAQPIVILAVIAFLWWYGRRSAAQGILK